MKKTKRTLLQDSRDLIRLITVVLFVPWFGSISMGLLGIDLGEFEAEVAVLVTFILFGSFWCGWLCPFGNLDYFISRIGKKLFPNLQIQIPKKVDSMLRNLKYVFLAMFIAVIIIKQIDYFFGDHMEMYLSTTATTWYIRAKKYFILLLPLLWPRFFCKYICFQKAAYNIINRVVPITVIKRDSDACTSCKKCDKSCPMKIDISNRTTIAGSDCIGCYRCVDQGTCPEKAQALSLRFMGAQIKPLWLAIYGLVFYYAFSLILILV